MSRIHDALRRAEEERSNASSEASVSPMSNEVLVEDPGLSSTLRVSPSPERVGDFPENLNLARLLACVQTKWSPDLKTMLFFPGRTDEQGQEEFRTLRSRLYQLREKRPLKTVLITSPLPKEGKTLIAANLAQAMACQHGRRILLIDADLRRPGLHFSLGTSSAPGLTEYLSSDRDLSSVIQRGPLENLYFIAAGETTSLSPELLDNGRFGALVERMQALFDWIVIDSPPAIPVSDASLLARHADGVLLVVKASETPFDVAQRVRKEFEERQLLGVVLNGSQDPTAYRDYYVSAAGQDRQK